MAFNRILIVDDEAGIRNTLRHILEDEGYRVAEAESGEAALQTLSTSNFDLLLLDVWLPGMDGLQVLDRMKREKYDHEVIVISGHGTIETAIKATRLGAFDFIEKPLSLDRVLLTVANALKKRKLEEKNLLLRNQLQNDGVLIGESPPMVRLRNQINRVAPSEGRVLIFGENGTGKEMVARLIHAHSDRCNENFIEVNCAAIPTELIESELFGHRKGSFTGAIENKQGKFFLADGGTLLLDEVGDMSLAAQAKVLRVLQEQTFEMVGGGESVHVDVRVIAATNKDLVKAIRKELFREDLFYRLNVIPITVPPLRERPGDIPLLADHFLSTFAMRYGKEPKVLSQSAINELIAYPWLGNVRELRNLMERIVIMVSSVEIQLSDLPLQKETVRGTMYEGLKWEGSLNEAKDSFEREYLRRALKRHGNNVSRTAEELNIERRHLYRRMARVGFQKENANGND